MSAGDSLGMALGHASIQLTLDIYSHFPSTVQQIAAQRMDAFFGRRTSMFTLLAAGGIEPPTRGL